MIVRNLNIPENNSFAYNVLRVHSMSYLSHSLCVCLFESTIKKMYRFCFWWHNEMLITHVVMYEQQQLKKRRFCFFFVHFHLSQTDCPSKINHFQTCKIFARNLSAKVLECLKNNPVQELGRQKKLSLNE